VIRNTERYAISQFETGKVSATDEPAVALWCIFAVGQDSDAHR
jgi:hypothetical protein